MAFAMPAPVIQYPPAAEIEETDGASTSASKKSNASQRTTVSKLMGHGAAVGADDPLETLSEAGYRPNAGSCYDPRFPDTIYRPADLRGPSVLQQRSQQLSAAGSAKVDMVAARVEDLAGGKRKKKGTGGPTLASVTARDHQWENVQEDFPLYVQEQQRLGRHVEGDFHQFGAARQQEAVQLESALRPYAPPPQPPRRSRGPRPDPRGPPPQKRRAPKVKKQAPQTMTVEEMLIQESKQASPSHYEDYQGEYGEYGQEDGYGYGSEGRGSYPPRRGQRPRAYQEDYQGYERPRPRGPPPSRGYAGGSYSDYQEGYDGYDSYEGYGHPRPAPRGYPGAAGVSRRPPQYAY